jgi:hypothetical protein
MPDRYPTPQYRRTALAPGILGALVALAGVPLIGVDAHTVILFAVSILAAIVAVFAWQSRWYFVVPLAFVVVAFNPVLPIDFSAEVFAGVHYVSALIFIAAAIFVRVINEEDRNKR